MAVLTIKPLNVLLLGDNYAQSVGLNVKWVRVVIMGSASLMAGGVVAYAGPIGFSWHCHSTHCSRHIRHFRPSNPRPRVHAGRHRNRVGLRNTRRTTE